MAEISVIIPVYNRPEALRRAFRSLVNQSYKDFEVIVCDDGSDIDLTDIIDFYNDKLNIIYIKIDNSGGPARPRNVAAMHANSDWLSFLDSDDWWKTERLGNLIKYLNDDVDILYHPLIAKITHKKNYINHFSRRKLIGSNIGDDPYTFLLSEGNQIPNSSVIVRKSKFDEISGFCEDPSIISLEDYDLWIRLARHGAKIKFINNALGYYWIGNDNISAITDIQVTRQKSLFERHQEFLTGDLADWAKSYHYYVLGTYLSKLHQHGESLKYFERAYKLKSYDYQIKRLIKIILAKIKL